MRKLICLSVFLTFAGILNAQWVQCDGMNGLTVRSLAVSGSNLFAGTESGIYISSDNGSIWTMASLNNQIGYALTVSGNNIFAGTLNGVFISSNNGNNWTQTFNNQSVASLAASGNNIFAGTYNYTGVHRSTDFGYNWTQTSLNNQDVHSIAISGNNIIYAGTVDSGVYLSTNNGTNWTHTSLNDKDVECIVISGSNIFAGTYSNGVFLSYDNGMTWNQTALNNQLVFCMSITGNYLFAGTLNGVFFSSNNGSSWIQKNQGFNFEYWVYSLLITNNYIFAGKYGNSVWRRLLSEIVSVQNNSGVIPLVYSLSQNYPNPFNPTTKIKFDVPSVKQASLLVMLKIYDIMGREIQTLISEKLQPGTYETTFDGSTLNSGIYFYKMVIGDFSETKRMILIK